MGIATRKLNRIKLTVHVTLEVLCARELNRRKKYVTCAKGSAEGRASEECFQLMSLLWPLPAVVYLTVLGTPEQEKCLDTVRYSSMVFQE